MSRRGGYGPGSIEVPALRDKSANKISVLIEDADNSVPRSKYRIALSRILLGVSHEHLISNCLDVVRCISRRKIRILKGAR